MDAFMKAVRDTFSIIFEFINEIQEMGCIENSTFSCNFVTLTEDFSMKYAKSLRKFLENLQELQSAGFQKSSVINSSSNKEGELPSPTFEPLEQNSEFSHNSSNEDSNKMYMKTIKYKGGVCPYNDCLDGQRTTSECMTTNYYSKPKINQIISEKQSSDNFYSSLSSYHTTFENISPYEQTSENSELLVEDNQTSTNDSSCVREPVASSSYDSSDTHLEIPKSHSSSSYNQNSKMERKSSSLERSSDELKNSEKSLVEEKIVSNSDKEERDTTCSRTKEAGRFRKRGASFDCTVCHRSFKTLKYFSLHMKKIHSDEECISSNEIDIDNEEKINLPVFCCRNCHLASSNLTNFRNHFCKAANDGLNQICNKVLVTNIKKLQQLRKFICDTCGVEFRTLKRILYHLSRCIPGPYQCNICSILFISLKDLNYHKKKDHKNEKCFSCDECGKSFLRKTSLRKHCINRHEFLESAENKKPSSFKCDACPKNFIKKIFLTNHKIRMHGLEKKFLCQVCGKKFMSNNSLMIHIEIHTGEKKFICQYCYKKFQRKEKLLHHERMHTGERPFKCCICNKAFVSKARLNEHVRRHEADKRFECSQCDKSYASSWDLKKHMLKKHDLQISTQQVKVSLKKKKETVDKVFEEKQPIEQVQNLPQIITMNTNSENMNMVPNHSTQQCQMRPVQIEQPVISVTETVPVVVHPSSTSVNLISFNENVESHCVPRVENHLNEPPPPPPSLTYSRSSGFFLWDTHARK